MMNGLKNREYFTTTVLIELKRKLRELSETTRIPTSKLTDEAIHDLLIKYVDTPHG